MPQLKSSTRNPAIGPRAGAIAASSVGDVVIVEPWLAWQPRLLESTRRDVSDALVDSGIQPGLTHPGASPSRAAPSPHGRGDETVLPSAPSILHRNPQNHH